MLVRRTNGFHPMVQLRDEVDRLMGDFFGPAQARVGRTQASFPALNVWEAGDALFAEAEVPGLDPASLDVSVMGSDLTIRGQRGGETPEGATFHRQERGAGEFTRVLRLPVEINAGAVEATLKDGVLLLKLPKAESAKPKKIQVTGG